VSGLEKSVAGVKKGDAALMKNFAVDLKESCVSSSRTASSPSVREHLQGRRRQGSHPGDIAARGDILLMRWSGGVTPHDAQASRMTRSASHSVAEKVLPVLKSYKKDK